MTTSAAYQPLPELTTVEPVVTAVVKGTIAAEEVRDFFDRSFGVLGGALAAQGVTPTGPAFALYRGIPDETMDLRSDFPPTGPSTRTARPRPASCRADGLRDWCTPGRSTA